MERLAAEIAFFQGGGRATQSLMPLPDWEILPYDLFSRTRTSPRGACRPV